MNVKPGDLAVIVRTHPSEPLTAQFLGRVVRIVSLREVEGAPCWTYERMPLIGKYRGCVVEWYSVPDEYLRPLRDPGEDARDETLEWLRVPATKEVA
jgi:hypothetical protein